ncbi:MAG: IcmT/TraK family protein [Proteobacteria bacterium]|nr:IcmT/TraK family protein [Pseudomonadota bacterium]
MRHPDTVHWRDSSRTPKFFFMDAYSAIPLLLFLLRIRLWTFILACSVCAFFIVLNRFGFTLPVFLRWLRSFVAGKDRYARSWLRRRRNKQ